MNRKAIKNIADLLASPRNVVIVSHINPDGDAIGSMLSLYGILKQDHLSVTMISPNEFPSFLAWLPWSNEMLIYTQHKIDCDKALQHADLIFCLDFNSLDRLGQVAESYTSASATKVLVDHHLNPAVFTDIKISSTRTSSTAELVYELAVKLGKKHLITKAVAECIYVGIITDTGSLSYACNYRKTYRVVAELFKHKIDGEAIHRLVYDTYSEQRLRLLGYCISEKLRVFPELKMAYIHLTKTELDKFGYKNGDTEGVVNLPLSIEGVECSALFMEREDHIKISLRSKGKLSVNQLARKYYNGGGHHNAAGGNSYKDMTTTLQEFAENFSTFKNSNL